jgi:hypothetical protein
VRNINPSILKTYCRYKNINFMELTSSWKAAYRVATQKTSQQFMEPEASLPCSQEPSTGPYPQPHQSNPYHPIPHIFAIIILSSHLLLGLPSGLFPSGFPPTSYMHLSSPPFVLHALPISSFLTHHSDSTHVTLSLLCPNILLGTLFSNTLSLCTNNIILTDVS